MSKELLMLIVVAGGIALWTGNVLHKAMTEAAQVAATQIEAGY